MVVQVLVQVRCAGKVQMVMRVGTCVEVCMLHMLHAVLTKTGEGL